MSSVRKLAISGTVWTIAGYGTSQILRLGSNLILTRLLFPKLFGLIALVNVLIMGLHLFSDIGTGLSIIQNKRGDEPAFFNTVWTLQVIRSFGLWFGCLAIAWPVATLYGESQLLWLIPVVGLNTVIAGFNSTALSTLSRNMTFGKLAVFEFGGQVTGLVVMLVWAWFNRTIWALVVGSFASSVVQMLWSHRMIPGLSNRFAWDRAAVKEIFSFGKWILFSTAVTFVGMQSDRLILGKLVSFELLGIYGVALTLSDIPRQVISAISSKVLFPTMSKLVQLPRETFRAKILQPRRFILIGGAILLTLLVSFGDTLILALYDKRYTQAAWMLPILALGMWPNLLYETLRQSLMAIGKPYYEAFGQFYKSIFMCIGLPLGFHFMGILGAVIIVALNDFPLYATLAYGLHREGVGSIKQDAQATILLLLFLTLALMSRVFLNLGLPIDKLFV